MTMGFYNGALEVTDAATSRTNLGITAIATQTVTQHDVLVGGSANAITSVSPSTSGLILTSNGTGSDPSFQLGFALQQIRSVITALQHITATFTLNDTIPTTSTAGTQVLSVTITPKSASSVLLVEACVMCTPSNVSAVLLSFFRDAGTNAVACTVNTASTGSTAPITTFLRYYVTSGSTSSTTFNLYVASQGGTTLDINGSGANARYLGGVSTTTLTVTEYAS